VNPLPWPAFKKFKIEGDWKNHSLFLHFKGKGPFFALHVAYLFLSLRLLIPLEKRKGTEKKNSQIREVLEIQRIPLGLKENFAR